MCGDEQTFDEDENGMNDIQSYEVPTTEVPAKPKPKPKPKPKAPPKNTKKTQRKRKKSSTSVRRSVRLQNKPMIVDSPSQPRVTNIRTGTRRKERDIEFPTTPESRSLSSNSGIIIVDKEAEMKQIDVILDCRSNKNDDIKNQSSLVLAVSGLTDLWGTSNFPYRQIIIIDHVVTGAEVIQKINTTVGSNYDRVINRSGQEVNQSLPLMKTCGKFQMKEFRDWMEQAKSKWKGIQWFPLICLGTATVCGSMKST